MLPELAEQPPFLKENTTLRDALKKRSKEPTPWNALESSHKYFAEQAANILAECKHKAMAQKVVDVSYVYDKYYNLFKYILNAEGSTSSDIK